MVKNIADETGQDLEMMFYSLKMLLYTLNVSIDVYCNNVFNNRLAQVTHP